MKREKEMKTELFDYDIEPSRIAQEPASPRDSSRLMVADRKTGELTHTVFKNIASYFSEDDVLVLNNTKVMKCRLRGKKKTGGSVEILLLRKLRDGLWESLVKPSSRLRTGYEVFFENGASALLCERNGDGLWKVKLQGAPDEKILEDAGEMPLPPYIRAALSDEKNYQTVYAEKQGSAAAPTAGLHFTEKLLSSLREKGVRIAHVTLHIHLDTFRPVKEGHIEDHRMYSEFCVVPEETAAVIRDAKKQNKKVFACGTTSVRALEAAANDSQNEIIKPFSGFTDLYITPGYAFRITDAMLTNFHFPRSTLLVLVSAFMGLDAMKRVYAEAMSHNYRFFSFGDAMLIL